MAPNPFASGAVPPMADCKCCGALSPLAGVVDFSRSCVDAGSGPRIEPYSGRAIYYYACPHCGFVFTKAFDDWSPEDFSAHVYNQDYILHDPEYAEIRPQYISGWVEQLLGDGARHIRVLDYGSGAGRMVEILRERGFSAVEAYDPISSPHRPRGTFSLVTCFEVLEHTPDPMGLMKDIVSYLADDGVVYFSTGLCTPEILAGGLANWSYCAPRNGHISFYSRETLFHLAREFGLHHAWFDDARHIFYRSPRAAFIERLFPAEV
jgi:SAM-dependent methyltransferase